MNISLLFVLQFHHADSVGVVPTAVEEGSNIGSDDLKSAGSPKVKVSYELVDNSGEGDDITDFYTAPVASDNVAATISRATLTNDTLKLEDNLTLIYGDDADPTVEFVDTNQEWGTIDANLTFEYYNVTDNSDAGSDVSALDVGEYYATVEATASTNFNATETETPVAVDGTFKVALAPFDGSVSISGDLEYGGEVAADVTGVTDEEVAYGWGYADTNNKTIEELIDDGSWIIGNETGTVPGVAVGKYLYVAILVDGKGFNDNKGKSWNVSDTVVAKKSLTPGAITASDKTYDGTDEADVFIAIDDEEELVGEDEPVIKAKAQFSSADAGDDVSLADNSGSALDFGSEEYNALYTLADTWDDSLNSVTANIAKAPLTVAAGTMHIYYVQQSENDPIAYNESDSVFKVNNSPAYTGLVNNQTAEFTPTAVEAGEGANTPGDYNVSLTGTIAIATDKEENYDLTDVDDSEDGIQITIADVPATIMANGSTIPSVTSVTADYEEGADEDIYLYKDGDTTVKLEATVVASPDEDAYKNVTWESANEEIATVDANGLVTAVGIGSTTVKAISVTDESVKSSDVNIVVNPTAIDATITLSGTARVGETLTAEVELDDGFTGTPDYKFKWSTVEGEGSPEEIDGETGNTYTISADDLGKKIQVELVANTGYTLGTVSGDESGTVAAELVTYTIKYYENGGSGEMAVTEYTVEKGGKASATLRKNAFTRSGYTFSGWNTAANGSGTKYTDGQSFSLSGDLELYAQWTANDTSGSSSSSSSGSSSNSTTKTTTNADGTKTVTTTTKSGTTTTVTESTTKTDGTKEVIKTSTDSKTGTVTKTETTTKTDGSKEETKTVTNKDGSSSVTETDTAADGSQDIVATETTADGDVSIVTSTVSSAGKTTSEVSYTATSDNTVKLSNIEATGKTVTIPATVTAAGDKYKVTRIAANALKGNKTVTKVVIGKNVKVIGKNAFNGDSKLKTISIKGAVKTVGKNAFKGINKNATITIKASAKNYKKTVKAIKKSGIAKTVTYKRTK